MRCRSRAGRGGGEGLSKVQGGGPEWGLTKDETDPATQLPTGQTMPSLGRGNRSGGCPRGSRGAGLTALAGRMGKQVASPHPLPRSGPRA